MQSKKSRRNKSKKKPSRHDHSDSSYSDDDSVSSVFSYSSSSDEDYRSRKGRSRSRADVKSKKKKAERRVSSDRESSEDSLPLRKRKRSKRKRNSDNKRKSQKKRRRDMSISSATSDSLSCSSCQYLHSSSSEDSEFESPRVRSRKKMRDKRDSDKHKIGARRSRSKSVNSPSSEVRLNFHSDSQKGEEHKCENNVRRIRSVITVVEHPQEDEENQVGRDCEEDISENNDSDNGATMNKLAYHSDILPDKSRSVEDMTVQESSGSDDLELILRQKALENLRKFRGKVQTEGSKDVHLTSIAGQSSRHGLSREVLQSIMVESENATEESKKAESGVTEQDHIQQSDSPAISKSVNGDGGINEPIVDDESKPGIQAMQDDSLRCYPTLKQVSPKANPLDCKSSAAKILAESCQPLTHGSSDKLEMEAINAKNSAKVEPPSSVRAVEDQISKDQQAEPTSSIRPVEDQSSKDQQAEASDSSHFQQKTMSVMRSGEMVQVRILSIICACILN